MRLVLGLTILLLVPFAFAQESKDATALADAPSAAAAPAPAAVPADPAPVIPAGSTEQTPGTHRFWDRENVLLFSGVAAFRALDYASTKNFLARGRTEVLLPDDIVYNNAGFASLEAAATATSVGISYWFHRTGHHKMERWLSITHLSVTAFGDAHNYALKTHRPH